MFVWTVRFKVAPGKGEETIAWLKEGCKYVNEAFPPATPWQVLAPVFGEMGLPITTSRWNTLADIERCRDWMRTDKEFAALQKRRIEERLTTEIHYGLYEVR